ncbi:MAG: hypothetical protein J7M34_02155 [Anaerolineae bacterium]|nr:hypothetical protein [Anaerolineae bacterium]
MKQRPDGVLIIALYHFAVGALALIGLCVLLSIPVIVALAAGNDPNARNVVPIVGVFMVMGAGLLFVVAIANLATGWGLWRMAEWGRVAAIVLSIFRLLNFPVGTVIGGLMIWYLLQQPVVEAFRPRTSGG